MREFVPDRAQAVVEEVAAFFCTGSAEFRANPCRFAAQLLDAGPVHRLPGGTVVVLGHREADRVLRDPRFGHGAAKLYETTLLGLRARSFMQLDAPVHAWMRGRVSPYFAAHRVSALREVVGQHARALVDECAGREAEFVTDFAEPLAMSVIADLLGVPPQDRERFHHDSRLVVRGLDDAAHSTPAPDVARARYRFVRYFHRLAELRGREPGDDVVSAMRQPYREHGGASTAELVTTCGLLLSAGFETTVDLLGSAVLQLARLPEEAGWRLAERPGTLAAVVEETLRLHPPVQLTFRGALTDAEIDGIPVRAGTLVGVILAAANRDPAVHDDPHAFRPERHLMPPRRERGRPSVRHLAFGAGPHFCLGAALGRLEARTALAALAPRRPRLTNAPWAYKDTLTVRGLDRLPVHWRTAHAPTLPGAQT
ncbi:cytochrome P450 [Streptomyces sp. NPDC026206]|uniref:cytochrome P450 n=1 Tax=Streptomyces sp. NPDC026206 TaxID=3157089 RepID=UPI0033DC7351